MTKKIDVRSEKQVIHDDNGIDDEEKIANIYFYVCKNNFRFNNRSNIHVYFSQKRSIPAAYTKN